MNFTWTVGFVQNIHVVSTIRDVLVTNPGVYADVPSFIPSGDFIGGSTIEVELRGTGLASEVKVGFLEVP